MQETVKKYLEMIDKNYLTTEMIDNTIKATKVNLLNTINDLVWSEFEIGNIQKAYDTLKENNKEIVEQIEAEWVYAPRKENSTPEYENIKSQIISMTEQINNAKVKTGRVNEFLQYYYDFIDGYEQFKKDNFNS